MIEFPSARYERIEPEVQIEEPLKPVAALDPIDQGPADQLGYAETLTVQGQSFPACRKHGLLFATDRMSHPWPASVVWNGGVRLVIGYGRSVTLAPPSDELLVCRLLNGNATGTNANAVHVVSASGDEIELA